MENTIQQPVQTQNISKVDANTLEIIRTMSQKISKDTLLKRLEMLNLQIADVNKMLDNFK